MRDFSDAGSTAKSYVRFMSGQLETVIVGGGQAGLAVGYYLAQLGRSFLILDENERTGDSWRTRWDSLQLFTPAYLNALPGLRPRGPQSRPSTKDEMADYLEAFATRFDLPFHPRLLTCRWGRSRCRAHRPRHHRAGCETSTDSASICLTWLVRR
jgi:cation diffusion facilitator CzcD-associated flavoprotein CzcO